MYNFCIIFTGCFI